GVAGFAEAEIMGAALGPAVVAVAVADADPSGVAGEVLRLAVVLEIVEVDRARVARLHGSGEAEAVEGRAVIFVARGQVDGERFAFPILVLRGATADGELHLS